MAASPHCIVRKAARRASRPPLLFVHGAYAGAWCWDEHFLPYFAAHGHDAWAVDLRGHGGHADDAGWASLDDYVADVLHAVAAIGEPAVLVGHSMGAIVVQRAWREARAAALALLAPVPLQGLLGSSLMLALNNPEIFNEINKLQMSAALPASTELLARAIFSPQLPAPEVRRHLRRMRPESQRALIDLSWPQQFSIEQATVPVRVFGAQLDRLFPPQTIGDTARWHGGTAEIIPGLAHAMMLDANRERAAARIAAWLDEILPGA